MFWNKSDNKVQCNLCQRGCMIAQNKTGFCKVRKNLNGVLQSLNYGKAIALNIDTIEKKPLYHFYPRTQTLSVAAMGCTLACKFCQNFEISRKFKEVTGQNISPLALAEIALNEKQSKGISWTYTEPTVFYEYFYDTMKIVKSRKSSQYSVWVTNGYTSPEAIAKTKGLVDAVNIDYKGPEKVYKQLCGAELDKAQKGMKTWKKQKIHIELTNLLIPGWNDSNDYIIQMCSWIKENIGNVPLHLSRYYPYYKMPEFDHKSCATSLELLEKAHRIAKEYLDYVYIGNIHSDKANTYCPQCEALLIERVGMTTININLDKDKCPKCGKIIPLKV